MVDKDTFDTLRSIAEDKNNTLERRVDATLAMLRAKDPGNVSNNPDAVRENEAYIKLLMADDRGHEIVVRSVLKMAQDIATLNAKVSILVEAVARFAFRA